MPRYLSLSISTKLFLVAETDQPLYMRINYLNSTRGALLRWYDQHRRALPWRRTRDPYAIWIAETMLQQTQVKTALPYYHRFLSAFPTLRSLAHAPRQSVLALWSGLGYYRRAENLIRAAHRVVREHGGKIPRKYEALRSLPGIGPYTAGALMSIAFDQAYPALDGNARRVLGRVFEIREEKRLQELAQQIVSGSRPGHLNQALMELGATVCRARNPNCPRCPLARRCRARSGRLFSLNQVPTKRPRTVSIEWPVALIQQRGKILLRRRPEKGLLRGLWELPGGERKNGENLMAALCRQLDEIRGQVQFVSQIGEVRHSITHRRIRAPVYKATSGKYMRLPRPGWRWVPASSLQHYPLSSLSLKAIRLLSRP